MKRTFDHLRYYKIGQAERIKLAELEAKAADTPAAKRAVEPEPEQIAIPAECYVAVKKRAERACSSR